MTHPFKVAELRHLLYTQMGAPVHARNVLGRPSVNTETLRKLAIDGDRPYGKYAAKLIELRGIIHELRQIEAGPAV